MRHNAKSRRPITYSEAHNKAVKIYQKSAIFILWAGILNVFASIVGVIQSAAGANVSDLSFSWPTSGFSLCLSVQMLFNSMLIKNLNVVSADILMIIIALLLGGIFAVVGFFAAHGKRWCLYLGSGLYAIDFIAMFFVYVYSKVPLIYTNYIFTLVVHALILVACLVAIVEYYNVIHIEKVFKGNDALKMEEEVESEVIAHGK